MSLTQLTERVYVYRGGVNFALIAAPDKRLVLIDSGLDSSNARKALRPFLESGHRLSAIINTHSHADHIGGNADLVKRTGCEVWAPARERPWVLWPELEPIALYGGAWPPPALQGKFLQAQPTPVVHELPAAAANFTVAGVSMELVPTPGHSIEQVAVAVDGVLVAGDAIFQPEVIAKHPIIFLVNVAQYLESLRSLAARPERFVLPGHGELIDRGAAEGDPLPEIIRANVEVMERMQAAILDACKEPLPADELFYRVLSAQGKRIESEPQFFLDRAAVSAHISYLMRAGQVSARYVAGRRLLQLDN